MTALAERAAAIAAQARARAATVRERNRDAFPELTEWLVLWVDMGKLSWVDQPRVWGKTAEDRARDAGGLGVAVVASAARPKGKG